MRVDDDERAAAPPAPALVSSIQVGLPRRAGVDGAPRPMDRSWTSGIWKDAVAAPVWCGRTNLAGDGQADVRSHGGPEKAVLAYAASHYPLWRAELGIPELGPGGFGENLTVDGFTERDVCIGDTVSLGDAVLQLSQPRGPCWKLGRRWRVPDLPARAQHNGRTGWYYRVLEEGEVAPGQRLTVVDRPHPEWTVDRANLVMYEGRDDPESTLALAAVPLLSSNWRATLERRGRDGVVRPDQPRLVGPNED